MSSNNLFPRFDMSKATASINLFSLNIHDSREVTPTLHRVVLSYTGELPNSPEQIHQQISSLLKGHGAPVVGSFSHLTKSGDIKSLIGFVKASRPIIEFNDEVKANADGRFKAMASNLLMDKTDESMWEIRSGATGKYLAKQSHTDMTELVHLATASVFGLPKFSQIEPPAVAVREFASFVDVESEEVMNGFVVASDENGIKVMAFETNEVVEAGYDQLIELNELTPEEATIKGMEMPKEIAADQADPNTMIEYYRKAYPYAPEYVQKIIEMINMHRTA
jgi:hypothetical protein